MNLDQTALLSSLIRVHSFCSRDKIYSEMHLNFCSRCKYNYRHFQDQNIDKIRVDRTQTAFTQVEQNLQQTYSADHISVVSIQLKDDI